ncbi:hypothetical protein IFR05_017300 [Cadophora sp. M221]|nr:hypothetical protein IFR05_017300 [Cadophora sp. M221]
MPIGIGTVGNAQRQLNKYTHEFDNTEGFIAPADTKLPKEAVVSSLMDLAQFSKEHTELVKNGIANVVLQGGYRIINDKLVPDSAAANNRFDLEGAATFHQFMQDNKFPSTAWTKVAANATPIYSPLFEFLDETDHPLGHYLRSVQTSQELNFYARCCSDHPFAPQMTQDWAVKTKSQIEIVVHAYCPIYSIPK